VTVSYERFLDEQVKVLGHAFRSHSGVFGVCSVLKTAGAGLAGLSLWNLSARADRDLVIQDSYVSSGGGAWGAPR
jgi:hypothetical protein